jgi:hypothetical protein
MNIADVTIHAIQVDLVTGNASKGEMVASYFAFQLLYAAGMAQYTDGGWKTNAAGGIAWQSLHFTLGSASMQPFRRSRVAVVLGDSEIERLSRLRR